jgi:peptidoglycan/LPS O-acetylase OafA/YrhL
MRLTDEILKPAANNLTIVRLLLASAVIYSHTYERALGIHADGLSWLLGSNIAAFAVDGFFVLSGFLVYRSLAQGGSIKRFALARATRLLPALVLMVALTVVAGLFVTSVPVIEYLTGEETLKFIANATLIKSSYTLTGVSCHGGPCTLNGSLWTLPWEARCYALLALLAAVGLANRKAMLWFVLPCTVLFAAVWDIPKVQGLVWGDVGRFAWFSLNRVDRLWTAFAMGIAIYEFRDRIRLSWYICAVLWLVLFAIVQIDPKLSIHWRAITIGYTGLCLGFLTARHGGISGTWPDYSYGIYIYAYPLMVALDATFEFKSPYTMALANLAATIPFAAFSWHVVEHPALQWLRRRQKTAFEARREPSTDQTTPMANAAGASSAS